MNAVAGLSPQLIRLIASHVFLHACMAGTRLAAPLLALREGYSAMAVGALLAMFALSQVFVALPVGRYADRHGLRKPFGIAVATAVGGASLAAAFPVFPVLCLAALMTGGATAGAVISLQRYVGRAAEGTTQLRQVFSWLAIGPAFSNFLGPFVAGLAIDFGGFTLAFVLMAILPLLSWAAVRGTRELAQEAPPASARGGAKAWDLLREQGFRRLLLVNWVMASCWDLHTFVVPVLGHERGLSASVIGMLLGAFAMAAAVVRIVTPLLAASLREGTVVAASMVSSALIFAVYPFTSSALGMGLCSIALGLSLGMVQPMLLSTLHQITPRHRHGEALGLRLMAVNTSSVAMPLLFGAVGAVVGASAVFWIVGAGLASVTRVAYRLGEPASR